MGYVTFVLPVRGESIAATARVRPDGCHEATVTPDPLVSVIVPVFGESPGLGACLDGIARQTYTSDRVETIVVDNGCRAIDRILSEHPAPRLVREPLPGSFAARNAGLRIARGDVVAFTDADCLPPPEWIERGVSGLARTDATGILAGRNSIVKPRPRHVSRTAYLYSKTLSFHDAGFQHSGGFGATANLFVRRAVLDEVGPFDWTLLSGGDMDWGRRAAALGYHTRYVPDVHVTHQARAFVGEILRRELRLAGGVQLNRQRIRLVGRGRMLLEIVDVELRREALWALRQLRSPANEAPVIERAAVAAVVALVQVLRAAERIRVLGGGAPRRA